MTPPLLSKPHPTTIPFDNNELDDSSVIGADNIPPPCRYNLHSQDRHIIQSAIDNGLIIPPDHITFAFVDEETGKALEY
jgi:hypothetical protein